MSRSLKRARQRGATLLVGMVMLVLLTLLALSAINLSTVNLKVVGNMQYQQEAMSAAQIGLNTVMSKGSYFHDPGTSPTSVTVDMTGDGTADYTVALATPCILAKTALPVSQLKITDPNDLLCLSSSTLTNAGIMGQNTGAALSDCAKVTWQITATVNDAITHANVQLVQAASQRMDRILADAYAAQASRRCP